MDRSLEAMAEEVGVVVHTEREVEVQRREEVGIECGTVRLVAVGELRVCYELHGVVPAVVGL